MRRDDTYRLRRIVEIGDELLGVIAEEGITCAAACSDVKVQWMVSTPLLDIGEQANCVSRAMAERHPEVPWAQVAGLRHRLVHDYGKTDWSMIAQVLFEDLKPFLDQVRVLI